MTAKDLPNKRDISDKANLSDKVIITVALTGAEVTKEMNPALPVTPEELIQSAVESYNAGAAICHVHVRNSDGTPSHDPEFFRQVLHGVRERCPMIVQFSTGGAIGMTYEERMTHLKHQPDMATLNCGSMNFGGDIFLNPPEFMEKLAGELLKRNIKPELEVYDIGMIHNAVRLLKAGILLEPLHFDLVMGVQGGIPGTPKNLLSMVEALPSNATWTVAGIGKAELPLAVMALVMGGHVRVGLEDNIYYAKGVLAKSNSQLVERIKRIAIEVGRIPASPDEARQILSMSQVETAVQNT